MLSSQELYEFVIQQNDPDGPLFTQHLHTDRVQTQKSYDSILVQAHPEGHLSSQEVSKNCVLRVLTEDNHTEKRTLTAGNSLPLSAVREQ